MLAVGVALFLAIRHAGESLRAPGDAVASTPVSASGSPVLHVLLALAAVVIVGRVLGRLLSYMGQPPVIGEVLAGICLGPSLLGRLAPEAASFLLPASVA